MAPTANIIFNMLEEERKTISSTNSISSAGPTLFSPEVPARKWYSGLLTWKFVALMLVLCLLNVSIVNTVLILLRNEGSVGVPATTVSPQISNSAIYSTTESFSRLHTNAVVTTPAALFIPADVTKSAVAGMASELRFITRAEWGAQPSTESLAKLKTPVPYVIISHTATDFCRTQSECTFRVRFAQTFHIESRNWSDIAYNFLIGGDGYAYVGRGWDSVGAHSYNYNTKSIGISFIGTFNTVVPPKRQLVAAQQLIEYGVEGGKISTDYKLLGHRQISETLSPGDALYTVMAEWPHWSQKP